MSTSEFGGNTAFDVRLGGADGELLGTTEPIPRLRRRGMCVGFRLGAQRGSFTSMTFFLRPREAGVDVAPATTPEVTQTAAPINPPGGPEQQSLASEVQRAWASLGAVRRCSPDEAHSYVPGVRTLYCDLRDSISVSVLERLSGQRVFVSGPHQGNQLDFTSFRFGHYNPRFVHWAINNLIPENGGSLARVTLAVYEEKLKIVARAYAKANEALQNNPPLLARLTHEFQADVDQVGDAPPGVGFLVGPGGNLQKKIMDAYPDRYVEQLGVDPYNFWIAVGFWVRREIDGTRGEFANGLQNLLMVYDQEYAAH